MSLLLDALKKAAQDKLNNEKGADTDKDSGAAVDAAANTATSGIESLTQYDTGGFDIERAPPARGDADRTEIDDADTLLPKSPAGIDQYEESQQFTANDLTGHGDTRGHTTGYDSTQGQTGHDAGTELELEPLSRDDSAFGTDTTGLDAPDFEVDHAQLSNTDLDRFLSGGTTKNNYQEYAERRPFAFADDDAPHTRSEHSYSGSMTENLQAQEGRYYSGSQRQASQMFAAKAPRPNNARLYVLSAFAVLAAIIVGGMIAYGYISEINDNSVATAIPRPRNPVAVATVPETRAADTADALNSALLIEQEDYSEVLQDTLAGYEDEPIVSSAAASSAVAADKSSVAKPNARPATKSRKPTVAAQAGQFSISRSESLYKDPLQMVLMRGYQSYQEGDLETAEIAYRQALTRAPRSRDALLGMAAVNIGKGDNEQAGRYYQQLLMLNPKDDLALAGMAALKNQTVQDRAASAEYSRIKSLLEEKPDSPHLHFTLANMLAGERRWAEAQQSYFDAHRLARDNPDYAYNLAVSLEHLGQPQAARRFYERALLLAEKARPHFPLDAASARIQALSR